MILQIPSISSAPTWLSLMTWSSGHTIPSFALSAEGRSRRRRAIGDGQLCSTMVWSAGRELKLKCLANLWHSILISFRNRKRVKGGSGSVYVDGDSSGTSHEASWDILIDSTAGQRIVSSILPMQYLGDAVAVNESDRSVEISTFFPSMPSNCKSSRLTTPPSRSRDVRVTRLHRISRNLSPLISSGPAPRRRDETEERGSRHMDGWMPRILTSNNLGAPPSNILNASPS
jgi:hypothetical protein